MRKKLLKNASIIEMDLFCLYERYRLLDRAIGECYNYYAYMEETMKENEINESEFYSNDKFFQQYEKIYSKSSKIKNTIRKQFNYLSIDIIHARLLQFQDWSSLEYDNLYIERPLKLIDRNDGILFNKKRY